MKNASFYVLAILVFGLIGTPMYHQVLNYKGDNVLGVNAFAESDDKHDSQNNDNEKEDGDQSNSEDQNNENQTDDGQSEDANETDTQNHDNSDNESSDDGDHSENATNNEPQDNQSEDANETDTRSEDNADNKQKSETKSEQMISQLEQKISQLEKRIQGLLEKVQNGEYFGNTDNTSSAKSYVMSFDGTATSIQDSSVSAPVSADIFAENIMSKDGYSKLRITGGHVDVGKTTYDIVFGKARVTDNQQGSSMLLVAEVMDDSGEITTIRMNLDSAQSFQTVDTQPVDLKIENPQSKIAGQWVLEGTGSLSS